jgi:glyoxylase-like metal-dependent hydrolase (beta-lactamase superfamily II)
MTVTNTASGTNVQEIGDGLYRINTPVEIPGGAFSFNQYLLVDEEPLLFHTGGRALFPLVSEAIGAVLPLERLRWIGFSHWESDESGALNLFLGAAPRAMPLCGRINAMINADGMDRPPRALANDETLTIGRGVVRWLDAPHAPHGWECGFLMEETSRTLLCGDLLTQPGPGSVALTRDDVLGPSQAFRGAMDYWSEGKGTRATLLRLAALGPTTLACMHGSAFAGDGAGLLRALAGTFEM